MPNAWALISVPGEGRSQKNQICWVMKPSFQFLSVRIGGSFAFDGFCFWCLALVRGEYCLFFAFFVSGIVDFERVSSTRNIS